VRLAERRGGSLRDHRRRRAKTGLILTCDHAQATIPPEFADLGLPKAQLSRHIAYDIGAERVSRTLAAEFDCPAVMSRFSRLLIDPNRGEDDPTLGDGIADGSIIPGNARIDQAGIHARIRRFYRPYDDAISPHDRGDARGGHGSDHPCDA